jgi:peptidoglycan hydrolase-like protein with peptidoglycan-binding domain
MAFAIASSDISLYPDRLFADFSNIDDLSLSARPSCCIIQGEISMALRSALFQGDARLEAAAISPASHITPGSNGPHVAKIQRALNIVDNADLDEDGNYDPATAAAVLAYKRKRNIINTSYQTQADNIVGAMTVTALDNELPSRTDPSEDLDEYTQFYDLALSQLMTLGGRTSRGRSSHGLAFFMRQKPLLDEFALKGFRVSGGSSVGAVQVGVAVVVILVILAFAAAVAIVIAQNAKATAQEIARLEHEFETKMAELARAIEEAPFKAIVLIAVMISAVKAAIDARIKEFQRQMDRCRQTSPERITNCSRLFDKISEQIRDINDRTAFQTLLELRIGVDNRQMALLLIGLARSMGFLFKLISDWAGCMGCTFLQFL